MTTKVEQRGYEDALSWLKEHGFDLIEAPPTLSNRLEWASNIAYCQWSIAEMKAGLPWQHLKSEGLV